MRSNWTLPRAQNQCIDKTSCVTIPLPFARLLTCARTLAHYRTHALNRALTTTLPHSHPTTLPPYHPSTRSFSHLLTFPRSLTRFHTTYAHAHSVTQSLPQALRHSLPRSHSHSTTTSHSSLCPKDLVRIAWHAKIKKLKKEINQRPLFCRNLQNKKFETYKIAYFVYFVGTYKIVRPGLYTT